MTSLAGLYIWAADLFMLVADFIFGGGLYIWEVYSEGNTLKSIVLKKRNDISGYLKKSILC